jgi:hypothetical protein
VALCADEACSVLYSRLALLRLYSASSHARAHGTAALLAAARPLFCPGSKPESPDAPPRPRRLLGTSLQPRASTALRACLTAGGAAADEALAAVASEVAGAARMARWQSLVAVSDPAADEGRARGANVRCADWALETAGGAFTLLIRCVSNLLARSQPAWA